MCGPIWLNMKLAWLARTYAFFKASEFRNKNIKATKTGSPYQNIDSVTIRLSLAGLLASIDRIRLA